MVLGASWPAGGCVEAVNYPSPGGPRYAASYGPVAAEPRPSLTVVTLNLRFARHVDQALRLFGSVPALARADLVLLQEMDAPGADAFAAGLGMSYVYYPATVHAQTGRDFGNAVLSRFPIVGDRKVALPHPGLLDGSRRAATCATVQTPLEPLEVCSVHVATPVELLPGARRAQVRAVFEELRGARRAIVGGDLNSHELGRLALAESFDWPTREIGDTTRIFSVDHLFTRGLRVRSVGKVPEALAASDHEAVWTELVWR